MEVKLKYSEVIEVYRQFKGFDLETVQVVVNGGGKLYGLEKENISSGTMFRIQKIAKKLLAHYEDYSEDKAVLLKKHGATVNGRLLGFWQTTGKGKDKKTISAKAPQDFTIEHNELLNMEVGVTFDTIDFAKMAKINLQNVYDFEGLLYPFFENIETADY
ncbi:MAG: hypothetical protein V4538_02320 [Bacteroidota bacterium]